MRLTCWFNEVQNEPEASALKQAYELYKYTQTICDNVI